ncbi:MAG: hypothetical protein LBC42_03590 [Puniceicoccales bacterium]|nr:hypothetical protein [Puniceicoccales bacterium]
MNKQQVERDRDNPPPRVFDAAMQQQLVAAVSQQVAAMSTAIGTNRRQGGIFGMDLWTSWLMVVLGTGLIGFLIGFSIKPLIQSLS